MTRISISPTSSTSAIFIGPYQTILDAIRTSIVGAEGQIVEDSPQSGTIEGKFSYGIGFGIRVRWELRSFTDSQIFVQAQGMFVDAMDVSGKAQQKAVEQLQQLFIVLAKDYGALIVPASPISSAVDGPPKLSHAEYGTREISGKSYSGWASWSLALGLIALLIGPVIGLPAVILGGVAIANMHKTNNHAGKARAISGMVIGVISSLVGGLLFWIAKLSE